jgi:hypothetical protein
MRKLYDLKNCAGDAPEEPPVGSSQEDWDQYYNDFNDWFLTCMANPILGHPLSFDPPEKLLDNKGYVWTKSVSLKGVDFKLDLFESASKSKLQSLVSSDGPLVIAVRISLTGYLITTLSKEGVQLHVVKNHKIRITNLLGVISNHTKLPNTDPGKISKDFWNSQGLLTLTA